MTKRHVFWSQGMSASAPKRQESLLALEKESPTLEKEMTSISEALSLVKESHRAIVGHILHFARQSALGKQNLLSLSALNIMDSALGPVNALVYSIIAWPLAWEKAIPIEARLKSFVDCLHYLFNKMGFLQVSSMLATRFFLDNERWLQVWTKLLSIQKNNCFEEFRIFIQFFFALEVKEGSFSRKNLLEAGFSEECIEQVFFERNCEWQRLAPIKRFFNHFTQDELFAIQNTGIPLSFWVTSIYERHTCDDVIAYFKLCLQNLDKLTRNEGRSATPQKVLRELFLLFKTGITNAAISYHWKRNLEGLVRWLTQPFPHLSNADEIANEQTCLEALLDIGLTYRDLFKFLNTNTRYFSLAMPILLFVYNHERASDLNIRLQRARELIQFLSSHAFSLWYEDSVQLPLYRLLASDLTQLILACFDRFNHYRLVQFNQNLSRIDKEVGRILDQFPQNLLHRLLEAPALPAPAEAGQEGFEGCLLRQ